MTELQIRLPGWRLECQRPTVYDPAGVFVARVFPGHDGDGQQIGLGMTERSMDAALADANRSACETVQARSAHPGKR